MKALVWFMMVLATQTFAGTKDSGGDPMTQQFLRYAQQLSIFVRENPFHLALSFSASDFGAKVESIDGSIKDEKIPDLLEFTDETLHDKDGREKAAVFNSESGLIRVNRGIWANYSVKERLILVVMEITGLLRVESRYENAEALVQGRESLITGIPLAKDKYEMPGWRIAGEDPDQFAHLSAEDPVIDLGVLGTGDSQNVSSVQFLKDPSSSPESIAKIMDAWFNQRAAYLETRGVDGRGATITSFYVAQLESGQLIARVYTLFFRKVGQAFSGVCANNGSALTTAARITNCYLNTTYYLPYDGLESQQIEDNTEEGVRENVKYLVRALGNQIEYFYAHDRIAISEALRSYYIPDYSGVVPGSMAEMQDNILIANGLTPTLMGPFSRAPFWTRGKPSADPKVIRLNAAANILAQLDLVYVNRNMSCPAVSGELPPLRGGQIISNEAYTKYMKGNHCIWLSMGESFPGAFYNAMVSAGFYYDYALQKWILDPQGAKKAGSDL